MKINKAEIITLNKTEKVEMICIKKGCKRYYFKGKKKYKILEWINNDDIELHWFINSLK